MEDIAEGFLAYWRSHFKKHLHLTLNLGVVKHSKATTTAGISTSVWSHTVSLSTPTGRVEPRFLGSPFLDDLFSCSCYLFSVFVLKEARKQGREGREGRHKAGKQAGGKRKAGKTGRKRL